MVDRFADLRSAAQENGTNAVVGADPMELSLMEKGGDGGGGTQSAFMREFFDEVGLIKNKMAQIRRNIAEIGKLHDKAMTAIMKKNDEEKELDGLMNQTNQLGMEIKNKLKKMEEQNKHPPDTLTPAEIKIRHNLHSTLTRQFVDLMREYQEKQEAYKGKIREKVVRQIQIVKPEGVNEELMEEYMQGKKQIFTDVIIGSQVSQAYEDIQARHKEILKLEESLRELHQLFVDMAVLVDAQGELLDQIENQVNNAVGYTEKGAKELEKANYYQKKSRKKMCCLIVFFSAVVAVVLGLGIGLTSSHK